MLPSYQPELYRSLLADLDKRMSKPFKAGCACIIFYDERLLLGLTGTLAGSGYTLENVWEMASDFIADRAGGTSAYIISNDGGELRVYACGLEDYVEIREHRPLSRKPRGRPSALAVDV
jgi:hypothetical protein